MEEQPTCGKGLAENAVLPAKLAEVIAALAENLEAHQHALDPKDPQSRPEYDLPMARHDEQAMASPRVLAAFEKFVRAKQDLAALLQKTAQQDQDMLTAIRGAGEAAAGLSPG